jgi:hypothetical protein
LRHIFIVAGFRKLHAGDNIRSLVARQEQANLLRQSCRQAVVSLAAEQILHLPDNFVPIFFWLRWQIL